MTKVMATPEQEETMWRWGREALCWVDAYDPSDRISDKCLQAHIIVNVPPPEHIPPGLRAFVALEILGHIFTKHGEYMLRMRDVPFPTALQAMDDQMLAVSRDLGHEPPSNLRTMLNL